MKREFIFAFAGFFLIYIIALASAEVRIEKEVISDVIISEINEPALFLFHITNLGNADSFEIYSLADVDMTPRGMFTMGSGETKNLEVGVYPADRLRRGIGLLNFVYKLRGSYSGITEDTLTVNIVDFNDAIDVSSENIAPDSSEAIIYIENEVKTNFTKIDLELESAFFDLKETFSLQPLEKKQFKIPLDKLKMRGLAAGQYLLSAKFNIGGFEKTIEKSIRFVEKLNIVTEEKTSGIIFRERVITKTNAGNINSVAEIQVKKDVLSRLFTSFSMNPDNADRRALSVGYIWSRELKPGEKLEVTVSTNYLFPLILFLVIVAAAYFVYRYTSSNLSLKKQVSFIRTKGGEFALKVTVFATANKFVEKIKITDRLPGVVKLYERYGAYPPDKIDEQHRRLEWNIESMHPGEERVFSYIIYSKIGIIGRFELPAAMAIYEKDGKMYETYSNHAFFMNEPRKGED